MKPMTKGAMALAVVLLPATAMAMGTPPKSPPGGGTHPGGGSGNPTSVPEPATMLVLGGGLASLSIARKFGRPKR